MVRSVAWTSLDSAAVKEAEEGRKTKTMKKVCVCERKREHGERIGRQLINEKSHSPTKK